MENFLQAHKPYFATQIAMFNPPRLRRDKEREEIKKANKDVEHDTIIAVRIRPLLEGEKERGDVEGIVARGRDDYVDVHELRRMVNGKARLDTTTFQFDRMFGPEKKSDDVYEELVAPLVPWAWGGGVATLFAYGQTGSGKTFTIDALARRAAKELFDCEGGREVFVSVFELAGNVASDLLNDKHVIRVMEDALGETHLVGTVEPRVASAEELLDLLAKGMSFRKSAPTLKNDASSRTHAVCRIKIVNKDILETPDGLLFLIDLAGSEAASDVKDHSAERMKEAKEINVSLNVLKDCIRGRSMWYINDSIAASTGVRAKPAHIPYRSNTLTKILKHVFDTRGTRHCKTSVVACVGSSFLDTAPAKNTFRYAEILSVSVPAFKAPVLDERMPMTWTREFLREWIGKRSGKPPIDASLLAPIENGTQICRLPEAEFIARCLKTEGVDEKRARAFYMRLFALQIDSRKLGPAQTAPKLKKAADGGEEGEKENAEKPFTERLRAGMFVQLKTTGPQKTHVPIYMILSPTKGFEGIYAAANPGTEEPGTVVGDGDSYICCVVEPSPMRGAYEVDVGTQKVVSVGDMGKELGLVYDRGTRYYWMTV